MLALPLSGLPALWCRPWCHYLVSGEEPPAPCSPCCGADGDRFTGSRGTGGGHHSGLQVCTGGCQEGTDVLVPTPLDSLAWPWRGCETPECLLGLHITDPLPLHHPCKTKPCPHPQGSCSTSPGSPPAWGCRGMSGSMGDPSCQEGVCAGMSPAGGWQTCLDKIRSDLNY